MDKGEITGVYSQSLEDAVNKVKASEERRVEYMTMMVHDMEVREEGRAEGRAEGVEDTLLLSIRNLINSQQWTPQKAMDALGVPEEERSKYTAKLKS